MQLCARLITLTGSALACTNILIPSGSSVDGSTIIGYNADSQAYLGALSHWPARDHKKGELRPIYSWDYGDYLGAIPEVSHTYNVMGNTNEHQLTIGESTFDGLEMLWDKTVCNATYGCIDYGQLEWVTLARARTAREAIHVADGLLQTYGYASTGESFSIADPNEVWLMEIIGKGNHSQGAVWVATRIPDGHVCAHANQARTRQFHPDSPDEFLYSPDVVDFARQLGLYSGRDEDFSFADVYDPLDVHGARICEARVWSFFRQVAAPEEDMESYVDHVRGFDLEHRMPLYVKIARRLDVNDTLWFMRNKFQDTVFDPRTDVGGEQYHSAERLGHETAAWSVAGTNYQNFRPIGVPYTGWGIVAQQRLKERYSVLWFGVGDSSFSPKVPFYGGASSVPRAWDDSNCTGMDWCRKELGLPGRVTEFSMRTMWWVARMVANLAYAQYDAVAPRVEAEVAAVEAKLLAEVKQMDAKLRLLDDAEASKAASVFSYDRAETTHEHWLDVYGRIFARHADGYVTTVDPSSPTCGCEISKPEIDETWKEEVAARTGDKYRLPDGVEASPKRRKSTLKRHAGMRKSVV